MQNAVTVVAAASTPLSNVKIVVGIAHRNTKIGIAMCVMILFSQLVISVVDSFRRMFFTLSRVHERFDRRFAPRVVENSSS